MSNTGYAIPTILREYYADSGLPTGNVKFNNSSDPDYVAPVLNITICPTGTPIPIPLISCGQGVVNGILGSTLTHEAPRSGNYTLRYNAQTSPNTWKIYYLSATTQVILLQTESLSGSGTITFSYLEPQWLIGGNRFYVEVTGTGDNAWSYQIECPAYTVTISPSPTSIPISYPESICYTNDSVLGVTGTYLRLDAEIVNNAPSYYRIIFEGNNIVKVTKQTGNTWLFTSYVYATGESAPFDTTLGTGAYNGLLGATQYSGLVTEGTCSEITPSPTQTPVTFTYLCYNSSVNSEHSGTYVWNGNVNGQRAYDRGSATIQYTLNNTWEIVDSTDLVIDTMPTLIGQTAQGVITEGQCLIANLPTVILYNDTVQYFPLGKVTNENRYLYSSATVRWELIYNPLTTQWDLYKDSATTPIDSILTIATGLTTTNRTVLLGDYEAAWQILAGQSVTLNNEPVSGDFTLELLGRAATTDPNTFLTSSSFTLSNLGSIYLGGWRETLAIGNGGASVSRTAYDVSREALRHIVHHIAVQKTGNSLGIWFDGVYQALANTVGASDYTSPMSVINALTANANIILSSIKLSNTAKYSGTPITIPNRAEFDTVDNSVVYLASASKIDNNTIKAVTGETITINNVSDYNTLYQYIS